MQITRTQIKGQLRGWPEYPSNMKMPTKYMVELNGDKRWRRVYQRIEQLNPPNDWNQMAHYHCVKAADGWRDLLTE